MQRAQEIQEQADKCYFSKLVFLDCFLHLVVKPIKEFSNFWNEFESIIIQYYKHRNNNIDKHKYEHYHRQFKPEANANRSIQLCAKWRECFQCCQIENIGKSLVVKNKISKSNEQQHRSNRSNELRNAY